MGQSSKSPTKVRLAYPGQWPLRFGDYATGNVIHEVDADLAPLLLARGFVRVESDQPPKSSED